MPANKILLAGCAPLPLSSYLKALGAFRLLASQADPKARAYWQEDRFVLETIFRPGDLTSFFVERYYPTPVVAPWNGGSGFWPKDNRDGFDWIRNSTAPRLQEFRNAIAACEAIIKAAGWKAAPKSEEKGSFITDLRGSLTDGACRWLDAAVVLQSDAVKFPPLLGTGGNDGRLDFSNNFMRRLQSALTGKPSPSLLQAALHGTPCPDLEKGAVGQFAPGSAGGSNNGVGFDADSWVNPWDFVLCIEGALVFAAAAARRYGKDTRSLLSYPFTTYAVGAGSGATAITDEAESRAEIWMPIWDRPAGYHEVAQLFSEGRAVLGHREARDGLDFVRAVGQLGVARGIDSFQRHAFLMRSGRAYYAVPLGRFAVRERPTASLLSQLDRGDWLSRTRRVLRDAKQSPSVREVGQILDQAIFTTAAGSGSAAMQQVLAALGAVVLAAARRPSLRGEAGIQPPPALDWDWAQNADDGSPEFEIAWAIASLDAIARKSAGGDLRMPFRCHLAPLEVGAGRLADHWSESGGAGALAVWTGRNLLRDLTAVLTRRLIEAQRISFLAPSSPASSHAEGPEEQPLRGAPASLAAVMALLNGHLDQERIAFLACGLAWVRSGRELLRRGPYIAPEVPLSYALLKPLFRPDGIGEGDQRRLPNLLPLVRLLAAARLEESMALAQRLARSARLPVKFPPAIWAEPDPARLLAALLVPLGERAQREIQNRAYPVNEKTLEGEYA